MGFSKRLMLLLVIVLLGVQLLSATFVYSYLRGYLIDQGKTALANATSVFLRQMDVTSEKVGSQIQLLAQDYPLRRAIADNDHNTILSTLRNHGRRVSAARMIVVGLDGMIEEDTARQDDAPSVFPYSGMLDTAVVDGRATGLIAMAGGAYWMVVIPVKAPTPIAYVAASIPVDDALLENLRSLSGIAQSIRLAGESVKDGWSTLARSQGPVSALDLRTVSTMPSAEPGITINGNQEYLTVVKRLDTADQSPAIAVILDYPLSDALRQLVTLVGAMLLVLAFGLAIAVAGAILIARDVSRPIEKLVAMARQIGAGNYGDLPVITRRDEIGQLSAAFAGMGAAVREREAQLVATARQLQHARDEALRADQAKNKFLANMSHELRTPLNAVIGFGDLIWHQISGPIGNPAYVEFAGYIKEGGEKLLQLVDQMLDLAAIDRGGFAIAKETILIGPIVSEAIRAVRADAAGGRLELTGPDLSSQPPPVNGDADALSKVFRALLSNAIKFTRAGGKVTVACEVQDRSLMVSIVDTGIGIKPDDLARVTEPFYRASAVFDGQYQGAGLGLPFARRIVELHGGDLTIESELGSGTTVTVRLPLSTTVIRGADT